MGKFGTEKKCSYFGDVHFLKVFTFGGFTVCCFHGSLVYLNRLLKLAKQYNASYMSFLKLEWLVSKMSNFVNLHYD